MYKHQGLIFVISGPSGSGKTTLLKTLLKQKELKGHLVKSVSLTTRPRRSKERHGQDYFFITEKQFKRWQKQKKFLERTKYLGYYYATPRNFVEKQIKNKKHIILCLDLKGMLRIKRMCPGNTISIFILPPSLQILKHRMGGRCNRTKQEEIRQRLKLAEREIRARGKYDYCLTNNRLHEAVKTLTGIILKEIGNYGLRHSRKALG